MTLNVFVLSILSYQPFIIIFKWITDALHLKYENCSCSSDSGISINYTDNNKESFFDFFSNDLHPAPLCYVLIIMCKISKFPFFLLKLMMIINFFFIITLAFIHYSIYSYFCSCKAHWCNSFCIYSWITSLTFIFEASLAHIKLSKTFSDPWLFALRIGFTIRIWTFSFKIDSRINS